MYYAILQHAVGLGYECAYVRTIDRLHSNLNGLVVKIMSELGVFFWMSLVKKKKS